MVIMSQLTRLFFVKYMYNNDAADSAGIAMFWFVGEHEKLKEEK